MLRISLLDLFCNHAVSPMLRFLRMIPMQVKFGVGGAATLSDSGFEESVPSLLLTTICLCPGFAITAAGTIVETCCGLMYLVGKVRPSITMRAAGVNLSPLASNEKSSVFA